MALKKCKECGKQVSDIAKSCPKCGAQIFPYKNPLASALLSIIPGLGHVYNGAILRGLGWFIVPIIMYWWLEIWARTGLWGFITGWVLNIFDAYMQAKKRNGEKMPFWYRG